MNRLKASLLLVSALLASARVAAARETSIRRTTAVDRELRIGAGDTLRILPGVRLLFSEGVGLVVEGTLAAEGTASQPIAFVASAAGARWPGVRVVSGGSLTMAHVTIADCQEAVRATGGRLAIRESAVKNCEKGVTLEAAASAEADGLSVREVSRSAFSARQGSKATLRGCTFAGPGEVGLAVVGRCEVSVSGSRFHGLETGLQVALPGAAPSIRNCSFEGNKVGILTEFPGCRARVESCSFLLNACGIHARKMSEPEIAGCRIKGNERGVLASEGASPEVTGCEIRENAYGVYVRLSSYPRVNRCDLSDNSRYAAYLEVQSFEWVQADTGEPGQRQQQMLGMRAAASGQKAMEGNGPSRGAPRATNPKGGYVDFQRNYWGAEATRQMGSSQALADVGAIYDFFDQDTETFDGKRYARDKVDYGDYLSRSPLGR